MRIKVAIVNFELFIKPRLPIVGSISFDVRGDRGVVVTGIERDSIGKLSGGVSIASILPVGFSPDRFSPERECACKANQGGCVRPIVGMPAGVWKETRWTILNQVVKYASYFY